ncbi:fimbrial protein [Pantoea sp. Tr-811]|uniref:PilN domain-containing protein n=1 Tax=Pantoea sp. Tr-811 TaxID=2608361 RepID=UPI00141DAAA8|nr:PilN domain-containing protein [Pantoea sp. Tr-811]NIF25584.1 fimbrial protein [Pantoea sp. Tr-811]
MLRLNLLPWRERQRQAALRRLRLSVVGSLVVALCGTLLLDQLARQRFERQWGQNNAWQAEIDALDARAALLEPIRKAQQAVNLEAQALTQLRAGQGHLMAFFTELERTLPEGIQLSSLKLNGNHLQISGVAASGALVAQLMRDLERASVMRALELKYLKSQPGGDTFLLVANLSPSWS